MAQVARILHRRCKARIKQHSSSRNSAGSYIIEILVSLIIGALLAFALGSTLSEGLRLSSTSENEAYANAVVENLVECSRSLNYTQLNSLKGQIFDITDANATQTIFLLHQFPLLLDLTNNWDRVKLSKFKGSIKYEVTDGPEVGTSLNVSVTAKWNDSNWYDAPRTVSRSIVRIDPTSWSN